MKYRTIVADPPWDHSDGFASSPKSSQANPRGDGLQHILTLPYEAMSLEEIEALRPQAVADAGGAWLFLWTTSRWLGGAFRVMFSWGFRYGQTLVWHKTGNPTPFGGTVAPNHAEFLLVGKLGNPRRIGRLPSSVIAAPAPNVGQHSRKPEVFLDLIESVAPGPYLELFARRQRLGWDTWGNEALEHVSLEVES